MNISKWLLIHSASLYHVSSLDCDRNPTYGEAITLSNIWVNVNKTKTNGSQGAGESDSGTLYYDLANSLPQSVSFSMGDKVVFNGSSYYVSSIQNCSGLKGSEHYEIGLV